MSVLSAAALLFLVMDPLGNVPFFVIALQDVAPERRRYVVGRELLIALVVLVVFLFVGPSLLRLLHISEPALTITGGIILILIAVQMIFPSPDGDFEERVGGEPFVVPLAIPYVAGPSAMATMLLIMNREPGRWPEWLGALALAWVGTSVIILSSTYLQRYLGEKGLVAIERLMGMVLSAIATQMMLSGIEQFAL